MKLWRFEYRVWDFSPSHARGSNALWKSTGYQLPLDFVGAHPRRLHTHLTGQGLPGCLDLSRHRCPQTRLARSNVAQRRARFCVSIISQSVNPPGKSFHHDNQTTRCGFFNHSACYGRNLLPWLRLEEYCFVLSVSPSLKMFEPRIIYSSPPTSCISTNPPLDPDGQ